MAAWWKGNAENATNSIIYGYSLGKTQRILALLKEHAIKPVLIHKSMFELTECYRAQGIPLADYQLLPDLQSPLGLIPERPLTGELILTPPSWLRDHPDAGKRLGSYQTAFASGWMMDQGMGRHGTDHGFLLSDHADWNDLNRTIQESRAKRIFVQHRSTGALVRHLRRQGLEAHSAEDLSPERFARLPPRNLDLFSRNA
jgi:putative mRNA 3-end processing factor